MLVALRLSGVRLVIFCCWKYSWYSVVGSGVGGIDGLLVLVL